MKTAVKLMFVLALAVSGCGDDGPIPDDPDGSPPDPDAEPVCDQTVDGNICTIAGNGENGYDRDEDGNDIAMPVLGAKMSLPQDTVKGSDGSIYVLDWNNHRIRRISPDGEMLLHVAGRGELGGTLDDPANSDFNHPTAMLLSADGSRMYVAAWHNSKIRSIDLTTLEIRDEAGDGRRSYIGDGGPAASCVLDLPTSIAFDPDGNLIVMDQANQVIRKIDSDGMISRIAGICVTDQTVQCAVGVDPTPCPTPAGTGKFTCGDPATECGKPCNPTYSVGTNLLNLRMSQPFGQSADPGGRMLYDAAGNLYFADTGNHIIRRITIAGAVEVVAGVEPIAGVPMSGTSPDGTAATATLLNRPTDIALSDTGELYFTDVYNNCVRKVATDGNVYTVAGICGERGFRGDGGPATEALLKLPYGLDLVGDQLYIADSGNMRVRVVNLPD